MNYLMIEDLNTGATELVSLEEAERRSGMSAEEIEWALEEYGVCDGIDHTITDTRPAEEIVADHMEASLAA